MKKNLYIALALAALSIPAQAHDLSANVNLTSDYRMRGISMAHGKPSVQVGADYARDSGYYVGTLASTITWVKDATGSGTVEVDLYGGKHALLTEHVGYDVGAVRIMYPGAGAAPTVTASPNTTEVYAQLGYDLVSAKYSYVVSKNFVGWFGPNYEDTRGSNYIEVNGSYPLASGYSLSAHLGHQTVKQFSDASYSDWKVGVAKPFEIGNVSLVVIGTNANGSCSNADVYCWSNYNVAGTATVLTFGKVF